MIEKANKDGKAQTIEYQEEEILVSIKLLISIQFIFSVNTFMTTHAYLGRWTKYEHTPQPALFRTQ